MNGPAGIIADAMIPQTMSEPISFQVELIRTWAEANAHLQATESSNFFTPFQHRHWLSAWYDAQGSRSDGQPLFVVISDAGRRAMVALFPLIIRHWRGVRIAEFAGMADYNAPVLGAIAAELAIDSDVFWHALCDALRQHPDGCDLVRFHKMPLDISGTPNPLASLPSAVPSALTGHVLDIGEDYDAYRYTLEKTVRKELERSWRVFEKHPGAEFQRITDLDRALHVFSTLEEQQSKRMRELGNAYTLDDEKASLFHRDLITRGLADGFVVLTALTCGEEIVATLLGIRVGSRYLMVRISNAGQKWTNCSPGRVIIDRTMAAMHADGVRSFDFSVGSYDYKRRFGVKDVPLADLVAPLNWRGQLVLSGQKILKSLRHRADVVFKRG